MSLEQNERSAAYRASILKFSSELQSLAILAQQFFKRLSRTFPRYVYLSTLSELMGKLLIQTTDFRISGVFSADYEPYAA